MADSPFSNLFRSARLLLLLAFVGAGTGCSTFKQEWDACRCYCPPTQSIEGCWEGEWRSEVNNHHGRLRAIVSHCGGNTYHAHFHAIYMHVIPYEFETPLTVTQNGEVSMLQGQTDLGWLAGGVFTYDGQATACQLDCSYCAEKDHGWFSLRRVGPECGNCDGCDAGIGCDLATGCAPEAE